MTDYFVGRAVVYPTKDGIGRREMSCGVPQGLVLGPLLWNIGYDWVLRGAFQSGVSVTCYADDTLVLARGGITAKRLVLPLACPCFGVLNKSEAIVFHGPWNKPPARASIIVGGATTVVSATMKYLGLVLDERWSFTMFTEHFWSLAPRLVSTAGALGSLLFPNVGVPGSAC